MVHRVIAADVALNELKVQACQVHLVARKKAVKHPYVVAIMEHLAGEVRLNEPGSTYDKLLHSIPSCLLVPSTMEDCLLIWLAEECSGPVTESAGALCHRAGWSGM